MNNILFSLVILFANMIQGITGFAGTILAMPPGLLLVGYDVAKPVLNVLGLLSGVYVFLGNRKEVAVSEVKKVVLYMAAGILLGIGIKGHIAGQQQLLYRILGCFVLFLAVQGAGKLFLEQKGCHRKQNENGNRFSSLLLLAAGIVHGIFVSGGPLLIGYLSGRLKDKSRFRATISTVWIILNSMILIDDIRSGLWNKELLMTQAATIPFLLVGMWIGSKLYVKMSQTFFMGLTYVLLFFSGMTLLLK